MDALIKAVKSLLTDIESMKTDHYKGASWFGPFSEFETEDADYAEAASIEWPNLAIQADEVKKQLEILGFDKEIEGEAEKLPRVMIGSNAHLAAAALHDTTHLDLHRLADDGGRCND